MAKNHYLKNRLKVKTQLYRFSNRLNSHYNLSLAAAEILSKEILEEIATYHQDVLKDGQIWYTAVHKDEPAGKSLKQCRKVRVKLTLYHPEDLETTDSRSLKSQLVHRLSWEAIDQDGPLTIEDLARILYSSERTIRRIIQDFRKQDIFIPIRGYYKDIGPGTSHKVQAIRLYLKGYSPSKIAVYLAHHLQSIERYLNDFCVVMMSIDEGYTAVRIARQCKLSERLVREYQTLYEAIKDHPDYRPRLTQLQDRLQYLLKKKIDREEA